MRNCLIVLLGVAACSGDDGNEPNVPVATVTVTPSTSNIPVGGEVQLQAATLDASGGTLAGRQITWASSDAAIATVSPSGVVTGVGEGDATVTATSETKVGSAVVTVSDALGQIRVTTATTGLAIDPDGYTVILDEGAGQPIQVNGTLLLEEVAPGNHALTLTGVAPNCHISEQPVTVVVNARETTDASFTVACDEASALTFHLVSSGPTHACGVTTEDKVYCWGGNTSGQLGVGESNGPEQCANGSGQMGGCSSRPVAVLSELRFLSVSAGYALAAGAYTCGVTTHNRAYCWGFNSSGELGDGTTSPQFTPVPVAGGLSFQRVSAGNAYTCGVTTDNRAYCWGTNGFGQLGNGGQGAFQLTPVAVAGTLRFRQVSAGIGGHTCGITTDSLAFCWGANSSGQLGDSTYGTHRPQPVRVAGGHYFRQIEAGYYHTCAVTVGSRAFCWGGGTFGELGNGGTESISPVAVAGGLSFESVTAGFSSTCGVTTDNLAYCWGTNEKGTLGIGTTGPEVCNEGAVGQLGGPVPCSTVPMAVVGGHSFAQVDVRGNICARTEANVAYCWGGTSFGRLGNGERDYDGIRATPTPVLGPLEPSATAQARR